MPTQSTQSSGKLLIPDSGSSCTEFSEIGTNSALRQFDPGIRTYVVPLWTCKTGREGQAKFPGTLSPSSGHGTRRSCDYSASPVSVTTYGNCCVLMLQALGFRPTARQTHWSGHKPGEEWGTFSPAQRLTCPVVAKLRAWQSAGAHEFLTWHSLQSDISNLSAGPAD